MARTYATVEEAQVLVGKLVKMNDHVGIVERVFRYIDHYGPSSAGPGADNRPVMEMRNKHDGRNRRYTDAFAIEIYEE